MGKLKDQLIEIRKNDYDFTGYDLDDLISKMIKCIGTTDSELRDELIYTTFGHMIVIKDLLNSNQLNQLLHICVDNQHLFYGLGENETDSVFVRSFSVLVLALILNLDQRNSFLPESEIKHVKERLFTYARNEKDVRGYVEGKGWAHAVAHIADALGEIANNVYIKENEMLELFEVINDKVLFSDSVYSHNEDERMALTILNVIERGLLNEQQILNWIVNFRFQLDERMKFVSDLEGLNIRLNVRNFLYSLYFRLRYQNTGNTFQKEIEKTLDSIREF